MIFSNVCLFPSRRNFVSNSFCIRQLLLYLLFFSSSIALGLVLGPPHRPHERQMPKSGPMIVPGFPDYVSYASSEVDKYNFPTPPMSPMNPFNPESPSKRKRGDDSISEINESMEENQEMVRAPLGEDEQGTITQALKWRRGFWGGNVDTPAPQK